VQADEVEAGAAADQRSEFGALVRSRPAGTAEAHLIVVREVVDREDEGRVHGWTKVERRWMGAKLIAVAVSGPVQVADATQPGPLRLKPVMRPSLASNTSTQVAAGVRYLRNQNP
jgi:hypothetical protein